MPIQPLKNSNGSSTVPPNMQVLPSCSGMHDCKFTYVPSSRASLAPAPTVKSNMMRFIMGDSLDKLDKKIKAEATNRIEGKLPWPKIDNINAWMLSAETETFMKVGGLAEVAVQLPDEFNAKFKENPNNNMTIVSPLYVGEDSGSKKSAKLEPLGNGKYLYTGAEKNQIELEKVSTVPVRTYDIDGKKIVNKDIDVYKGKFNGTNYLFLGNEEYFSITPGKLNNPACKGAYVTNTKNIGEVERFTFFSKASYEVMKSSIVEGNKAIDVPNILMANDWHASALSSLMRYKAPVDTAREFKNKHLAEVMQEIPIIHVTHNAAYQGSDNLHAGQIFYNLFDKDTNLIQRLLQNSGYKENGYPLSTGYNNYNEALADLNLADRVVAVSNNYAEELCKAKDLGCGMDEIHNARKSHGTMLGIVNGYTKSKAEPNDKMVDNVNSSLGLTKKFKAYAGKYDPETYSVRMQNKEAFIEFLKEVSAGKSVSGVSLVDAANCGVNLKGEISKLPILTNIGRIVEQKGFDILVDSLTNIMNELIQNPKQNQEFPVVAVMGNGDPKIIESLAKLKQDISVKCPEAGKRIFVFDGFNLGVRDAIQMSGDFFLMPSKWEPCGLTQMEAMAKGNLPIATATGGLVDTISSGVDGFVTNKFFGYKTNEVIFDNGKSLVKNNSEAFTEAVKTALDTFYNNLGKIKEMSLAAMKKDFSWNVPGGALDQYIKLMKTGHVI